MAEAGVGINWQINALDLLTIVGAALVLYGRIVALETKVAALWAHYTNKQKEPV